MKPPDDGDEELIASMLHSADRNLPLPDPEFLRQLREASTRAFLEAAAQRGGDSQEPQLRPDHTISQEEGDSMISAADTQTGPFTLGRSLGGRGSRRVVSLLVGGVACAVAILVWLLLGPAPQVAHALDLRTALERTAQSQTLHLQIERSGQTEEAWMTQPGWLRVDHSDGTYDITRDNTVWRVDERENRAQSEPTPLGSSGADVHSRVFSQLLDLADGEELTSTQSPSVEVVQRNGRTLQRLQGELAGGDRRLQFDALIDAQTETLQSLRLLTDRDGALQPIVELRVVAANLPLAEEKFTVKPSLTEDGRVGKVTDRQGIVTLRPAAQQRWTPVCEPLLLRTGDWLRTDSRGAHAAAVKLSSQSVLTIGPGTLIEILSPNRVRLHTGELEVQPDSATPLELAGPGDQGVSIAERTFYRLTQEKLTKVTRAPPWLGYFQGTTHQESLGSLIAHPKGTTVETRNIPLTVGYHHVTVDIRDQIARTVIEESFVNRENVELEGVFYFPLPQDASISGFGMWIGNELVEADIVEKQRAREIYEQILREKRDPGLLEWSGGNIFKASVYPIPAHAEKRIKISYTQVLPARGTSYRYSYALQSDLLKLHPLRDLSLDVTVHSALPLRRISSPTHTVRADHTAHAAHVAFAAQDYVPTRDFEVVVETDRQSSDVTLIPHARGDDGYFMLQLAPPAEGTWQRDVVADGEPIELLILADTSLSIGPAARQAQAELVAALCGALAPRDRVNLAVCDVDCRWAFDKPRPAEPQHVAALREHLSRRHSLGWTDLDRAFASAFTQCGPRTQVVYIGDGIVTTGDGSPEEFSRRLKRLKGETPGACHAVAVGNSYETTTLRAIAALGGGTVRQVTGEQGPSFIALELLREISRPGMRDLRVEFHGLRTARVYPERLPNLPGGSQQILVGRYQPAGKDQVGEVVVTGSVEGKPVRLRGSVALRDAEQGNAFIPRLWARQHLDALLQQGSSPAIKDEIIALSEEFQIMTPYTSFLVLETDADRERFKVKRRFRMRDGEEYFQEGRDTASFALVHQAMQRAGSWRVGLQQSVLREFAQLERYRLPQPGRRSNLHNCDSLILLSDGAVSFSMPVSGPVPAGSAGFGGDFTDSAWYFGTSVFDRKESLEFGRWTEESRKLVENETLSAGEVWDALTGEFNSPVSLKKNMLPAEEPDSLAAFDGSPWKREADRLSADFLLGDLSENGLDHNGNGIADSEWGVRGGLPSLGRGVYPAGGGFGGRSNRLFDHYERQQHFFTVDPLFPALAAPSRPSREAPPSWSPPALELSRSLLRTEQLANLAGGLEIDRQTESFDPRWKELTRRARRLDLYSPAAWLTRSESDGDQMLVNWCDAKERGVLGLGFRLGRLRPSAGSDLGPSVLEMLDHSLTPLDQTYRTYQPSLIQEEVGEVFIILTHPEAPHSRFEIRIDANRRVLLSLRHLVDQKPVSTTRFSEFVEVAGRWWPGKIENLDDQERITSVTTQTIVALTPEQLAARTQAELAARSTVQLVSTPWPTVNQAKQAVADPSRTFYTAELALALHFARSQQWTRALEHLDRSEKLAAQQSGVRWIRDSFLQAARRHEPLKQRLLAESRRQDWPAGNNGLFLARHLVGQAAQVLGTSEMLELLEAVKPIYAAQPPHAKGLVRWAEYQVGYIEAAGQIDEALAARRKLAVDDSHDADQQTRFASALFHGGDPEEAYAWLERVLTTDPRWRDDEEQRLRNTVTQFLQQEGRYADLVAYLAQWTGRRPTSSGVYQHYLSALYQNDQVAEADQLIARWLNEGISGDTSEVASARLTASIQLALGQGHSFYIDLIDPQWLAPLARVAEYFAHRDGNFHPADLILGNSRFNASDEGRNLRLKIGKWLVEEFDTLPRLRLQRYVDWALGETGAVTADNWKGLAAKLQARWSDETDPDTRLQWSRTLGQILSQRVGREAYLNFLRLQWREAPALTRATHANELYNALLGEPWGTVLETELLELVPHLSDAEEVDQRLPVQIVALQRLVDWMVGGRNQTGLAKISDLEQLTRQKRAAAQAEQLRLARQETAQRLEEAGQRHEPLLVRWFDIERLTLRAQSDPDETTVVRESWAFLDAVSRSDRPAAEPPAADTGKEPAVSPPMDTTAEALSRRLQERHLSIIAYLALKPGAEKTQVERLLKAIDARIARGTGAEEWKSWKYRLLVALDRPVELQQVLTDWLQGDGANNRWRLSLGYLLAEQGAVPQAIALFEGVEVVDELDPLAYRALAGWYQAANRRESYEQAQRKIYQTLEEWRMGQWLQQQLQPWWRTDKPLPSELDRQVLLMFAALFEKSSAPENYLWQLQQFYQATHDFRLLAVTADAIQGRTAQRLYPFLGELRTTLTEVRDEATADRLVAHLTARRDQSDSPVDRRADDLLEALVERRAAELQNQPGPHVERAVAALRRAFRREWSPGEQRLMADLLSSLGAITAEPLAAEQLREMRELHDSQPAGTLDRLHICRRWSELTSYYGRPDRAIDQLAVGLAEYRTAHGGRLTPLANDALATWISFLVDQKHFVRAEQTLQDELAGATPTQQRLWLTQKLYDVYSEALQRDGTVSLGARDELFAAVEGRLLADLQTGDQNHRYQILTRLCNLYRVAHNIKLRRTAMALREFAAKAFPEALRRQTNNYQSLVMQVAGVIHDLLSPREALAFLLDRIDQEPPRFRYQNQDGWNTYGDTLAVWRTEAKELGDLQPRLLKIVLDALRKDLESQQRRHPRIYHRGYHEPDFWKAEADTFAKTADDVLVKFHGNNPIVQYVADYYWNGLNRPERAIEVLLVAHRDKELDENGRSRLIDWLHQTKRYGESIGLLQAMIEELPDRLQYRLWLMQALFHTNRRVELVALLEKTDADFHEKDRWTLGALAGLAETCLATQLYPQSLRYYEELIPKYRQAQPNGGLGDGTLSNYFANQARVHAALGQTAPAVEAASAAIVTWGPNREQRAAALTSLRAVVEQSPDLPAYIALLDRETQQTGQDRPIVRKTLGQVLLAKAQPQVALAQLQRAVEFQPNDPEIHQALVACFDALNDRAGAVNQLLLATTITPREWKLYDSLAERFTKLEQPREAERALTSIIDALPSEAESHSLLAEARQKQNQWKAAAEQWEQVVRIRSLEPTGFFNLAAAQIQAQQWDAAEATLKKLETTPWPGRFGNVPSQTQPLRQQWEQGRRK